MPVKNLRGFNKSYPHWWDIAPRQTKRNFKVGFNPLSIQIVSGAMVKSLASVVKLTKGTFIYTQSGLIRNGLIRITSEISGFFKKSLVKL